jgi:putative ATPase
VGYDYPHDHPGAVSAQETLPESVRGATFYEPGENEAGMAEKLQKMRSAKEKSRE